MRSYIGSFLSLFTHYTSRKLEWWLAIYTLYLGTWLLLPPVSMGSAGHVGSLAILPEGGWGALYVVVGICHMAALHINGRSSWTPFARLAALIFNSQVFFALGVGISQANVWGTGVATYTFIAVGFCGAAIYSAALDCGHEIAIWRGRNGL